ncbi:tryptophan--tRNA ligase, mitochondrial-like isoform X1 [Antedon mediterranea]|uniref:tryptophan--tRNA ligase, mitochondrial-like isoform X1 n=3 Tax=Antedon mediterranea TaxID=105859 RepID=UPI003AF78CA1
MAASVCRTCASQFRFKAFNFVQVSKSIQRRLSTPISMRIFSGIQPTGVPHIGNYLGAIKQWKDLQEQHRHVMYSIVDLHSIALPQDPKQLKTSILTTTAILLACGIDPERSILFQQSAVKEHAELAWVLGCKITLARLNSFTQWKAKVGSDKKKACVGLFTYPVLQSADILLYKSTHVPVGDDQKQHLEMAQEVARIFNNNYGEFFPIPKPIFGNVTKVKSLRDPTIKMSKSDDQMLSRIELLDTHDQIVKKLKKAVTDFTSEVTYDPQSRPGVSNIVMIHSAVSGKTVEDICNEVKGLETAEYKLVVAEAVNAFIEPIRYKVSSLLQDKEYLQDVLKTGADKAREIAEKNYNDVKQLVGFI